jgi:hypothetical protein
MRYHRHRKTEKLGHIQLWVIYDPILIVVSFGPKWYPAALFLLILHEYEGDRSCCAGYGNPGTQIEYKVWP